MSKEEAIQAMIEGKKVFHDYFTSEEFIYMKYGMIFDENDMHHGRFWDYRSGDQWETGWYIYNN